MCEVFQTVAMAFFKWNYFNGFVIIYFPLNTTHEAMKNMTQMIWDTKVV